MARHYFTSASLAFALVATMTSSGVMAGKEGQGRPASQCRVDCSDWAWKDHESCETPDENNEGVCPLAVAVKRGYDDAPVASNFAANFKDSASDLNKGNMFFRLNNVIDERKPNGIKITAWLDINNDGQYEAVGRRFHPDYMAAVGKKAGGGNLSKGQYLYDTIDVYSQSQSGWERTGAITNTTCVHARRALPGDFNNDGLIDVLYACHGFDNKPFPGSQNALFLNKGDGTFSESAIGKPGYYHGASTEDFNKDGFVDLLVSDAEKKKFYVFINDKNGGFLSPSTDYVKTGWGKKSKYYVVSAVDANNDGQFDLLLGGHENGGAKTKLLVNKGDNHFSLSKAITIPPVITHPDVKDLFAHNGFVYVLRSAGGSYWKKSDSYGEVIQKYNVSNKTSELIFEYECNRKNDSGCGSVFEQLSLYKDSTGKSYLIGENAFFTKQKRVAIK